MVIPDGGGFSGASWSSSWLVTTPIPNTGPLRLRRLRVVGGATTASVRGRLGRAMKVCSAAAVWISLL